MIFIIQPEKEEKIQFFYFNGLNDMYISISCEKMESNCTDVICDTVFLKRHEYEKLKNIIRSIPKTVSTCQHDTFEPLIFIRFENLKIWLNKYNNDCVYSENTGKKAMGCINNHDLYLIKSWLGYYNTFRIEDLLFYKEIKEYGIPKNYKYSNMKFGKLREATCRSLICE